MIARTIVFATALMATRVWAQSGFPALLAERPAADSRAKLNLFGQFVGDWLFEGVEYHGDGSRVTDKGEISFSLGAPGPGDSGRLVRNRAQ